MTYRISPPILKSFRRAKLQSTYTTWFYFGVGITSVAFQKMGDLLVKSIDRLESCSCTHDGGCFKCIANPRADEITSKLATRYLLMKIQNQLGEASQETYPTSPTDGSVNFDIKPLISCASCKATCSDSDRFCRNCGTKVDN